MNAAVTTAKRRPAADPFAAAVARDRSDSPDARRDWTRSTLATSLSLLAHALLLVVFASLYVSRRAADYAEVVPIEANLDVPLNLFDNESTDALDASPALVTTNADKKNQVDAPAKLETPSDDRQDFQDVKTGARALDANGKTGAAPGEGLTGRQTVGNGEIGQQAQFVGVAAVGRRIVFVIDRSASMNKPAQSPAIEWAKDELIRSIKKLQRGMSFQVIFYSDTVVTLPNPDRRKDLIPADEFSKERAIKFVRDREAEGGTNHRLGLDRAFELKPDVIFLMTDADDDTDEDLRRLTNYVTRLNHNNDEHRPPASIHIVHLWHGAGNPTDVIRDLPQRNAGSYHLIFTKDLSKKVGP